MGREDGARVGEGEVLLLARALRRGEKASEPSRRVRRETVHGGRPAQALLKSSRRRRDLERVRRRQLAALELLVERQDEPLEELEPPTKPGG